MTRFLTRVKKLSQFLLILFYSSQKLESIWLDFDWLWLEMCRVNRVIIDSSLTRVCSSLTRVSKFLTQLGFDWLESTRVMTRLITGMYACMYQWWIKSRLESTWVGQSRVESKNVKTRVKLEQTRVKLELIMTRLTRHISSQSQSKSSQIDLSFWLKSNKIKRN